MREIEILSSYRHISVIKYNKGTIKEKKIFNSAQVSIKFKKKMYFYKNQLSIEKLISIVERLRKTLLSMPFTDNSYLIKSNRS